MTVDEFAKSQGYNGAVYVGEWKRYKVYEPIFDEPSTVGLPFQILVDGETIRMSTEKEAFECIDYFNND